jgi:8-oxo-dGTP pyrophosphatase MutT (NUDIX family)
MANAHVWIWRDESGERQKLLQKRALHLLRRPGFLHASASGHVNLGEAPLSAAVRETFEELGVTIEPTSLTEVFMSQGGPRGESFNYVFAHGVDSSARIVLNADEVADVQWVGLSKFDTMRRDLAAHKLIDLGSDYYNALLATLASL